MKTRAGCIPRRRFAGWSTPSPDWNRRAVPVTGSCRYRVSRPRDRSPPETSASPTSIGFSSPQRFMAQKRTMMATGSFRPASADIGEYEDTEHERYHGCELEFHAGLMVPIIASDCENPGTGTESGESQPDPGKVWNWNHARALTQGLIKTPIRFKCCVCFHVVVSNPVCGNRHPDMATGETSQGNRGGTNRLGVRIKVTAPSEMVGIRGLSTRRGGSYIDQ
jgi:hypothetical protein